MPDFDLPPGVPVTAMGALTAIRTAAPAPQQNWLGRIAAIFHSPDQNEHHMESTNRILDNADSRTATLEAQLNELQRRSSR